MPIRECSLRFLCTFASAYRSEQTYCIRKRNRFVLIGEIVDQTNSNVRMRIERSLFDVYSTFVYIRSSEVSFKSLILVARASWSTPSPKNMWIGRPHFLCICLSQLLYCSTDRVLGALGQIWH